MTLNETDPITAALVVARDGYVSMRATGLPCLPAFTMRALALIEDALAARAASPVMQNGPEGKTVVADGKAHFAPGIGYVKATVTAPAAEPALVEAAREHIESLDAYDGDLVPINRTRGTAAKLRAALPKESRVDCGECPTTSGCRAGHCMRRGDQEKS
jgi:hypothetical protein